MYVTSFRCEVCGNRVENRLFAKVKVEAWCRGRPEQPHREVVRMIEEPVPESLTTKSKTSL